LELEHRRVRNRKLKPCMCTPLVGVALHLTVSFSPVAILSPSGSWGIVLRGPVGSSACSGVAARRRAVARRLGATARRAARCGAASPPPLSSSAVARCGAGRGRRRWRRGLRLRPGRGQSAVPWPVLQASGNASCNARAGTLDQHPTAEVNKQRGPMKCESLVQV